MDEQLNIEVNLNGIKSLKTELREANLEYQKLLNSSAATAEQIDAAARKVGMLKDEIGDAAQTAQALGSTEGKIAAIGNAAQVGISAFQGLQSVMALTGVESDDLQKTFVKLQALMGLQQAIEGLSKAGDAFNALKAVGVATFGSIRGALIATGIGAFAVGIGLIIANFEELKAIVTGTKGEFDALAQSEKDVNDAMAEGSKNAMKEKASLDVLYASATNVNLSMNERKKAVDKLQKDFPAYFGNISKENILNGNAKTAYDKLAAAILSAAKARALEGKLTEIYADSLEEEGELVENVNKARLKLATISKQYVDPEKQKRARELAQMELANAEMELNSFKKGVEDRAKVVQNEIMKLKTIIPEPAPEVTKPATDKGGSATVKKEDPVKEALLKSTRERAKIEEDYYADRDKKIKTAEENEINSLANTYEVLLQNTNISEEERARIKEEWATKRGDIEKKYKDKEIEDAKKVVEDAKKAAKEQYDRDLEGINMFYDEKELALKKSISDEEALKEALNQNELNRLKDQLVVAEETGQETIEIEKKIADKTKEIDKNVADNKKMLQDQAKQDRIDALNATFDAFNQIGNAAMALSDQVTKNKLMNVEKGSKEEEAILRKQFENQKKMQVAMALINGAQAITAILSVPDFTFGVASAIRIASAGVATALTVAKILSTQFDAGGSTPKGSKYAKGGLLIGRKHAEGGIMTNFGELEGGEFVVNRSATKNFLPLLEKINAGGGSGAPNNMSTMVEPMGQQPIIKTYVVASEVTSQQEAQRKIANLARL